MNSAKPICSSMVHPMIGFIALASSLVLAVALLIIVRNRNADSSRHVTDLSPVSGQWLADHRRSG
jgi:hypothetical protein